MLVDWLGAAPLLITKLKAAIPSLEEVQVVSSQAEAQAIAQLAPSCFVAWGGVAHEVVDAKDYAGIAYELQMRRK